MSDEDQPVIRIRTQYYSYSATAWKTTHASVIVPGSCQAETQYPGGPDGGICTVLFTSRAGDTLAHMEIPPGGRLIGEAY